ncbi:MAG TPA: hypothetical protein VLA14_16330 [Polyangia bacterium]|nr:hypothetical protein [Polyangia bacterium]
MLHRGAAIGTALVLVAFGVGVVSFSGCSSGGASTSGTAGAGAVGGAGTSGGAGSPGGAGASTSDEAGGGGAGAAPSGSAGSDNGSAGATAGGSAGSAAGGAAGGGAAGAGGATISTSDGGAAGATGTTGRPSGPSAGCALDAPPDAIGKATVHNLVVNVAPAYAPAYVNRKYYTTLPMGFDPKKPYPVVFWGPGCGATGPEGSSFTTGHFLTDILYVELLSITGCFQAGKEGTADSPDGPYFDQVVAEVEAKYCVDKGKLFAAGTSSGAWLSNYLACTRGNILRGTAADSGGLQHDHGTCTGGAAVMEMPGDSTTTIENGVDIGSGPARDLFITLNGCSMTPTTMTFAKASNCQVYGGCDSPVVWCNVGGAHQSGNQVIAESAWTFWSTLK